MPTFDPRAKPRLPAGYSAVRLPAKETQAFAHQRAAALAFFDRAVGRSPIFPARAVVYGPAGKPAAGLCAGTGDDGAFDFAAAVGKAHRRRGLGRWLAREALRLYAEALSDDPSLPLEVCVVHPAMWRALRGSASPTRRAAPSSAARARR